MASWLRQSLRMLTACVLVTLFAIPQTMLAQAHVVSGSDLHQQLLSSGQTRRNNLETVQRFLSSPRAEQAFRALHTDAGKVTAAVSNLSDEELANLAARANQAQADFAAGNINDHDLLIILIVVVILVLIIVAVHH